MLRSELEGATVGLARLDMATTAMCRRAGMHGERDITLLVESAAHGRVGIGRTSMCWSQKSGGETSALTGSASVCLPRVAEATREG
jgi:hypothetical protein